MRNGGILYHINLICSVRSLGPPRNRVLYQKTSNPVNVGIIPPWKNRTETRPYDKELSKLRNIIERFFHRLKQYRRVATRYDKLSVRYLGFVYFASILMQSKKNVNTT